MAYISTQAQTTQRETGLLKQFGAFLVRIGHAAYVARGMEQRMHRIEALRRMSDADLAKLGIQRDDIATHVFRDVFYS